MHGNWLVGKRVLALFFRVHRDHGVLVLHFSSPLDVKYVQGRSLLEVSRPALLAKIHTA